MDADRWKQVEELYHAALEREGSGRAAFLEQACSGDEALRRRVESLLAHHEQASGSFLEEPALEMAAKALAEDRALPNEPQRYPGYSEEASPGGGELRREIEFLSTQTQARSSTFEGLRPGAEFQGSDRFLVQR